eukprot:2411779-Rhodomonas_salina.1
MRVRFQHSGSGISLLGTEIPPPPCFVSPPGTRLRCAGSNQVTCSSRARSRTSTLNLTRACYASTVTSPAKSSGSAAKRLCCYAVSGTDIGYAATKVFQLCTATRYRLRYVATP